MPARNHENVRRRLRIDVAKGNQVLVFCNQFCWNFPGYDLAKNAIRFSIFAHLLDHSSCAQDTLSPGSVSFEDYTEQPCLHVVRWDLLLLEK